MVGGDPLFPEQSLVQTHSPIDGRNAARIGSADPDTVGEVVSRLQAAFLKWRLVPPPRRGELVRRIAETVRANKQALGEIITWEVGKSVQEAEGEVQEWIDLCDFAVGLSRQLYGLTIASERPGHRLMELWHPLGPVGVISAFNFPVAVWAWNAMIALVCGDTVLWKPSSQAPLCSLACQLIVSSTAAAMPDLPQDLTALVTGSRDTGQAMAAHKHLPLISATGSVGMGRQVAEAVAGKLGRSLLELGGNNGLIVTPSANLDLAIRAIVFAAVGTCGQRCTTLRRLIVHQSLYPALVGRLKKVYDRLPIGDPRQAGILVGPLINRQAFETMQRVIQTIQAQGGRIHGGERITDRVPPGGFYVRPALAEVSPDVPIMKEETFAPILYVTPYDDFETALAIHNNVPQGLSSAIFTENAGEAERFLSCSGSDCGLANVNLGTSGAEIGGAFGGEKETGGGRETGSDAWKNYMRRMTATINFSGAMPLAQGIQFDFDGS
ncbi:MAG: aldehyde dehydrogenase family protein [bacterium]